MRFQNPEDFVEALGQTELLFQDGDLDIDADGNPNLGFDGVGRRADEPLDPQMLFDPLEEQFYLPTALVYQGDGQCRQNEVVGQIDEKRWLSASKNRTRRKYAGYPFWLCSMARTTIWSDCTPVPGSTFMDCMRTCRNEHLARMTK